jgi:hypothetical protein
MDNKNFIDEVSLVSTPNINTHRLSFFTTLSTKKITANFIGNNLFSSNLLINRPFLKDYLLKGEWDFKYEIHNNFQDEEKKWKKVTIEIYGAIKWKLKIL